MLSNLKKKNPNSNSILKTTEVSEVIINCFLDKRILMINKWFCKRMREKMIKMAVQGC